MNKKILVIGLIVVLLVGVILILYDKNQELKEERNNLCYLSNNLIDGINSDSYLLYQINPILVENRTILNKINCSERLQ